MCVGFATRWTAPARSSCLLHGIPRHSYTRSSDRPYTNTSKRQLPRTRSTGHRFQSLARSSEEQAPQDVQSSMQSSSRKDNDALKDEHVTSSVNATKHPASPSIFKESFFAGPKSHFKVAEASSRPSHVQEETRTQWRKTRSRPSSRASGILQAKTSSESQQTATNTRLHAWVARVFHGEADMATPFPLEDNVHVHMLCVARPKIAIAVTFGSPAVSNSMDKPMLASLKRALSAFDNLPNLIGVALIGATQSDRQPAFCSGADFRLLRSLKGQEDAYAFIKDISNVCDVIRKLSCPVIAAIHGTCFGAGLEIAASCDIRMATEVSTFAMPEVLLGIPSVVHARLLCDIIGWGRARELMLSTTTWTTAEAAKNGLITNVYQDRESLLGRVEGFMTSQAYGCFPVLGIQKKLMQEWEKLSVEDGIEAGAKLFASQFSFPERRQLVVDKIDAHVNRMRKDKIKLLGKWKARNGKSG